MTESVSCLVLSAFIRVLVRFSRAKILFFIYGYAIVTGMCARLWIVVSAVVLLLCADVVHSRPQPQKLTLTYTTRYGGLKIAGSREDRNRPKLGLALAGGGAKAAAAIGVLKVLDQEGIPVSFIAGTSMGAGVGGLYAAGYSPDEITRIFTANDWNSIFTDTPRAPS